MTKSVGNKKINRQRDWRGKVRNICLGISRGAFAYADPQAEIGCAYVTNRMGTSLTGDPRDVALRQAMPSV